MAILPTMKWLNTIAVWVMLALWLPVTNHCRFEQIPGFSFLDCCNQDGGNSQDEECQNDGCAAVEDGLYKTESNQIEVLGPVLTFTHFLGSLEDQLGIAQEFASRAESSKSVLPEFLKSWQFSFRAASPPRAPSLAS